MSARLSSVSVQGKNLSLIAEEIAASHQREWEEWISELDDILSTYEKLLKKE